jgi:phosphoserine phosphatase
MVARAALFDMDRTLVRKETASLYVRYQREIGEASWRDALRVSWWVLQYTLGVIDAPQVAARATRSFEGMHETVLAARCTWATAGARPSRSTARAATWWRS